MKLELEIEQRLARIEHNGQLQRESFTENLCSLRRDTVYRLKVHGEQYNPYYIQDLGDRVRIFDTVCFGNGKHGCTDVITIAVFPNLGDAIEELKKHTKIVTNNQPYLD